MTSVKIFLVSLFIATIFFTSNTQAQTYMWEFGVEGGAGIRSLRFDPKDSLFKTSISFTGGIAGQYNINPMWSIKLGAAYERKGAEFEQTTTVGGTTTTSKGKFNVDYVAVPLLVKATFGSGKKVRFFVNAGPYVGILMASKFKNESPTTTETDLKDSTKKIDFGVSGGIGMEVLVGTNMGFTVEARDNFGLTDINDSKMTGASKIKTNTFNGMVGFKWKFGKSAVRKR